MQNFEFYAPTRMIFGKDTHKQVGKLVKEYGFKKVFVIKILLYRERETKTKTF